MKIAFSLRSKPTFLVAILFCLFTNIAFPQIITTVAGNGIAGYNGDGGAATSASLKSPERVAVDAAGNIYIADYGNNLIRKVSTSGIISTIAGNGKPGYSGDGGAATSASLNLPTGIAVDAAGNIYIADNYNQRIRKVNKSGVISTVAGNGIGGYSGDGGAATNARLNFPFGVAVDASGNIYIADYSNNLIRKVNTSGVINTVAGNGTNGYSGDGGAATSAALYYPADVEVDAFGNMYIADNGNSVIRKVNTSGVISTIAGNGTRGASGDGGAATSANLNQPQGVALDAVGNIYIDDAINYRIRKVNNNGVISTVAGNGINGYSGDGGTANKASLSFTGGISVDILGNIYIADWGNNRIRKVTLGTPPANPNILSFTPNSTCPGTSIPVFITGANLTGTTAVTVGGSAVDSFTVNDSTSITAYVSKGTTGKIAVTSPNGTATSDSVFTFGMGHTAYAYITNGGDGTVSVINTQTNKVVDTIIVGNSPSYITTKVDGTKVYVSNSGTSTVSVINTSSNTVTATIPVGRNPDGLCISPDGSKVYVANNGGSTMSVINTSSNSVTATIPGLNSPWGVAVSTDGSRVYVTNASGNTLSVIDATSNTIATTVQVGAIPLYVTLNPSGKYIYVGNFGDQTISVINAATNTITATIPIGNSMYGIAFSPDGTKIYVVNGTNTVTILNAATNTIITSVIVGRFPSGISISPDGKELYVSNNGDGTVSIINTVDYSIIATMPVGQNPNSFGNFIANVPTPCTIPPPPAIPSILSFTPNSTCPSTSIPVFITGVNLIGATAVTVGGAAVDSFTVNSAGSITAYISKGTTGKIAVTSPNGTATSDSVFTFGIGHTAYLYLPNTGDTSVVVYKVELASAIAPSNYIKVGNTPSGITSSPDGTKVYVSNIQDNTISEINTITGTVIATIQVGKSPDGLCVSPNGSNLYVANSKSNTLSIINTATNTIITTLNVGNNPTGICVSPDGKTLYVVNSDNNTVSIINTATNTTVALVPVGSLPTSISISPDGSRVYTTNFGDGTVSVINTAINSVIATVGVGINPCGVCVNPTGTKVYVVNQSSNTVSIINSVTNQVLSTINTGGKLPTSVSVSPDGTMICVICAGSSDVIYFDAINNAIIHDYFGIGNKAYPLGNFIINVPTTCGTPAPTILSFTPSSTCPGTSIPVFITGSNFIGATTVTVGGVAVDSFTVNSASSITAYISKGTTGKIAVTSPNGTATSDGVFTFGMGHTAYAYIVNAQNGDFTLINIPSDTIKPTKMPNVTGGWNVTASPDGTSLYVTNLNGQIYKVNTATNTAIVLHDFGPNSGPDGADISPDGTMLYVAHYVGRDTLSVLNTTTGNVINTIPIGGYGAGVCVSPDGSRVVAVNYNDNTVSIINSQTNTVIATLPVGSQPHGVCISPDGSTAYVDGWASNLVTVINLDNNTVIANIPVGSEPIGVCISPDGQNVYATNYNDHTVSVINTATNTVTTTIPIATGKGSWGGCITPDGTQLIVANTLSDNIAIISTKTNTVTQLIPSTGFIPGSLGKFIANVPTACSTPNISTFSPKAACPSTTVTINGSGFTEANAVIFGSDTAKLFIVVNDSTIIAVVDSGSSGSISVINTIGTSSLAGFIYLSPTKSTTDTSICKGNSLVFNGETYDSAGIYTAHLMNSAGCDSTATLLLSIKLPTTSTTDTGVCQGNTLTFNGKNYDSAGTYTTHLTNSLGCDSTATLVLTIKSVDTSYTKGSFCKTPFIFNGKAYDSMGTYPVHVSTITGCDSVAVLILYKDSTQILYDISGANQVCLNQTDTLKDLTLGGSWKSLDTTILSVDSIGVVNGTSVGVVKGLNIGTTNITYTLSSSCGSQTTPPQTIQVIGIKPAVDTLIYNATCFSPESGKIALSIIGSEGPYQDSLNGNWYTVFDTISHLGVGSYTVYIKNSEGCIVDTLQNVPISLIDDASCYTLYVPTGFVPTTTNPTGVTKLLKPFGGSPAIKELTFRVYNRFGGLVFESHDLISGWDGMINGTLQDTGTYIWMLDYTINNTRQFDSGTSVLIR